MKKIIGILGVMVIAVAMFFSTNTINSSNGDLNLANLVNMNPANAGGHYDDCDTQTGMHGGYTDHLLDMCYDDHHILCGISVDCTPGGSMCIAYMCDVPVH
jgi:hypothetical protein